MNKEEFIEMQNEFAEVVYNYENFLKTCIQLDYRYNVAFFPELNRIHYLELENAMLARCLQTLSSGTEDPNLIITQFQTNYEKELPTLNAKNTYAKVLVVNVSKIPAEQKMEFEEVFKKFIAEHHPLVQALATEDDKVLYGGLVPYYYEGNYEGYKKKYEELAPMFSVVNYPEDQYNLISQYYYDMRKNMGNDFNKKSTQYPFNKKDVFEDEMTIAREQGELKSRITALLRDNKKLHEDFVNAFQYDVKLLEKTEGSAA